ncbi:hypothetical protein BST85_02235 [Aureitalea marina]|uniref:Adhesin domain-containing protein n=1 Tax=Aureitalea marina TaxID=930804 RepID=A0A2S7KMM1_9FLAO|nr:hypothetical protein BST85_02235 [Aureitalea marina]
MVVLFLLCTSLIFAQNKYKESFKVGKDALVSVNTSHTDVIIETWNKDVVEVEALVEGEDLTADEKKEIFDNWTFDVLGNSKKVIVTSNEGSLWGGFENLRALEGLAELESLKNLADMPTMEGFEMNMDNFSFQFDVPDIPETDDFPNWPFTDDQPSVVSSGKGSKVNVSKHNGMKFDRSEYEKNKQAYVNKLNKKYKSNASVGEVDKWLGEVDKWAEEFEKVMEEWGENFSYSFENNFGPEFEEKMEKWAEEYSEQWEAWGEEFGEKLSKDMEKWGEEFGKDMEEWAEDFAKDAEKWAEKYEDNGNVKVIISDDDDDESIFIDKKKVKKTIIIRMPKGTRTDINVRHGEVKMADATNLRATLNYSTLTANSIDGGSTLINASYAPVYVNNWKEGSLKINYVEDCKLNTVGSIDLDAVSSDVNIFNMSKGGRLSGSFGNLFIKNIDNSFDRLNIILENTDATIKLPQSAFVLDYDGKRSRVEIPDNMKVSKTSSGDRTLIEGYKGSSSANSKLSITALYSKVYMQ